MKNAKIKKSTYENVYANCPCCKKENIYNRRSDLKDTQIFAGKLVKCFYCNQEYQIYDQLLQENYRYLLDETQDFIEHKNYRQSIINLCQSCEAFMFYSIKQILLYIPFNKKLIEMEEFNNLFKELHRKIKKFTFKYMRNLFFDIFLNDKKFENKSDISNYIAAIEIKNLKTPKNKTINSYPNLKLRELFIKLKQLEINKIRNKANHKFVYRPSLDQVIKHKEEVEDVIIGLSVRLWEKYRWKRFFF